jgi:HSP20 family protein
MSTAMAPRNRIGAGLLGRFRQEMEDLFERFVEEPFGAEARPIEKMWTPSVDVIETGTELVVKADLPGVDPKEVSVAIQDGSLVLHGERKFEETKEEKEFKRVERFFGSFYRSIPLPPSANIENVTAESSNGVLTIHVPKKPEAQPKKITVSVKGKG